MFAFVFFKCSSSDETQRQVDFTVDVTKIYETNGVNFILLNSGAVAEATWFFEGGEPEYYNDLNPPTIYYGKAGEYTVTLNVLSNGQKQVITKENYIMVKEKSNGNFNYASINAEKETIKAGESIKVWVTIIGENLQYEWSSSTGSIVGEGPEVEFSTGPCFEGVAEISSLVSNDYGSMERTIKINVIREEGF